MTNSWQRGDFAKCKSDGWAPSAPPERPVMGEKYVVGGVEHRFGRRWLILPTLGGAELWDAACFERIPATRLATADRVRVVPMLAPNGQPLKIRNYRE